MEIKAQPRKILGKKVKALRREGQIPAVIFGQGKPSLAITVDEKEFLSAFAEAGEATLVDLQVEGEEPRKVLITEVQDHPLTRHPLHVNFHEVNLSEKVTTMVPIETVGESPIVKTGDGILLQVLDEVEVECLPMDLPPEIKVDISNLTEIDQSITVKDLNLDRGKVAIKASPEELVLKIDYAQMAEEAETEVSEAEAVAKVEATEEKVEGEEEKKEGEEPETPVKEAAEKKE